MTPQRKIEIEVHYVIGTRADIVMRQSDLRDLYHTVDVDLQFHDGPDLELPAALPLFYRAELCNVLPAGSCTGFEPAAPLGTRAHLIIGKILEGNTLGALIHRKRGACVVCVQSPGLPTDATRDDVLFQVCAHEIGHLLNLLHDAPDPASTVMCQEGDRFGDCREAWKVDEQVRALDPGTETYPFSRESRSWISTGSREAIEPWGDDFRDGKYIATLDRPRRGATLDFHLDDDTLRVGDGIAFEARIRAPKQHGLTIPEGIGPEYGELVLLIRRPDGQQYVHRPLSLSCSGPHRRLKSGESLQYAGFLAHGPGGPVLPLAGTYYLEARYPRLGLTSPARRLAVEPDAQFEQDPDLHRALSRGRISDAGRVALAALLRSRTRLGKTVRPMLAYRLATTAGLPPNDSADALRRLIASRAPRFLRQRAAIALDHLARRDPSERARARKAVERWLGDPQLDRRLHETLTAAAEISS